MADGSTFGAGLATSDGFAPANGLALANGFALDEVTFRVPAGHVLGLLGRTGSGKTTLTRLLFRLYEPAAGTIHLGGTDIREVPLDDLRQHVGMIDLLYPPRCAGCGNVGALFCADCQAHIIAIQPPVCRRCGRSNHDDGLCPACQHTSSALDGITATAVFAPPLRAAIHRLKYENVPGLAAPLGALMAGSWRQASLTADAIVPVPLHAAREAERGYNQSVLLARVLGAAVSVPVATHIVIRQRATLPQVNLNHIERQRNVSGAFACLQDARALKIVLVDDVCTTGATLEACAVALRAGGAASVWALTLARARWGTGTSG